MDKGFYNKYNSLNLPQTIYLKSEITRGKNIYKIKNEKKELLKIIGLFIILFMYIPKFTAKNIINSDITNRSYLFFCDSIVKNDSSLVSMEIYFDGIANQQISDIFYISDCLGEISLIKDSIPNEKELNKLEKNIEKQKLIL